jgi:flavin-dependent dehydrogenase
MSVGRPIQIIGGGLAGLSLGLALQREGVAVSLVEAGVYPRHRVCGEFITGLDLRTRRRLGLDPFLVDAAPNRHVAWFYRDNLVRVQKLPAIAPSLSRHVLDERLARAFVEAGGMLRTGTRAEVPSGTAGCVFATGRRRSPSAWLGLKIHALDFPLASDLELHLGDDGYLGLSRIERGRVNICGLFRRRNVVGKDLSLLLGYLRDSGLGALAKRIASATIDGDSFCAVAAVGFDGRFPRTPDLRLGDAGAMIPPFTGHGMAMAFQSAETALDPLLAYARGEIEWGQTSARIQSALRRRFQVRLAAAGVLHPFFFQPLRQRWLAAFSRARLLPMRPLYAALH